MLVLGVLLVVFPAAEAGKTVGTLLLQHKDAVRVLQVAG